LGEEVGEQERRKRVLRLTLLVPDIVEAILDGRQPEGMTLPGLMDGMDAEWSSQRSAQRRKLALPGRELAYDDVSRRCRW
jgi:hypothetical protein